VTYSSYGKITRCSSQACRTTRQCEDESYGSQLAAITHYGLASFGFPTQVGAYLWSRCILTQMEAMDILTLHIDTFCHWDILASWNYVHLPILQTSFIRVFRIHSGNQTWLAGHSSIQLDDVPINDTGTTRWCPIVS